MKKRKRCYRMCWKNIFRLIQNAYKIVLCIAELGGIRWRKDIVYQMQRDR